jgi:YHS domain-containing protein
MIGHPDHLSTAIRTRSTTMTTILRAGTAALVFGAFLTLAAPGPAGAASDPVYTGTLSDVAVSGYDPVAYFNEGEPVEGSDEYEYEWMDTTWRFASPENLAAFQAEPEKYAPQYGGYCAYAVAQGYLASTDPHAWTIVDDKLYLNYSKDVQKTWEQDIPGYITKAEGNWPAVLHK